MTWTAYSGAVTLIAGATLNGITNGSWATGAAVDNSSDLNELMDVSLRLSSAVTPSGAATRIDVYLVPDTDPDDGTGLYATSRDDVAADTPAQYKVGEIGAMVVASGYRYGMLRGVVIPPGRFKIQIENNLGVSFPATATNACEGFKYGPA